METSELNVFWTDILNGIQEKIGSEKTENWFKAVKPLSLQGVNLFLEVPDMFHRYWIETNYIEVIEKTIHDLTGGKITVDLTLAKEKLSPETASQTYALAQAELNATKPAPQGNASILTNSLPKSLGQVSDPAQPPAAEVGNGTLNTRYIFDNFVIGNNNRLAHAAALAVAVQPYTSYNPLFIWGSSGLGKTHLMQAIGHYVKEHSPETRVSYVSSEKFTNELIASISQGSNNVNNFRNRYRNVDVLLIDDIQFIAGKERTQEEFFHTFNTLHEAGKQIVITSDRPPKEITQLEERLRSRFEWGMMCDIKKPDLETRTAILQNKAITDNLDLSMDILTYVAKKIDTNIRELEGVLNRVIMYAKVYNEAVSPDLIDRVLKDTNPELSRSKVTVNQILEVVAGYYSLPVSDLLAKKRTQQIVLPRHIAMYLCQQLIDISYPRIGEEFGGRDHTTVMHACTQIKERLAKDTSFAQVIKELKEKIEAR